MKKILVIVLGIISCQNSWAFTPSEVLSQLEKKGAKVVAPFLERVLGSAAARQEGVELLQAGMKALGKYGAITSGQNANAAAKAAFSATNKIEQRLAQLMTKDIESMSKEEFGELLSMSAKHASSRQSDYLITSACASPELRAIGVKWVARQMTVDSTKSMLKALPRESKLVTNLIGKELDALARKGIKVPKLKPGLIQSMEDPERVELLLALKKASGGTDDEKKLGRALLEFYQIEQGVGGENKVPSLTRMLAGADGFEEESMDAMSILLAEINQEATNKKMKPSALLNKWLEESAGKDQVIADALQDLRRMNCF